MPFLKYYSHVNVKGALFVPNPLLGFRGLAGEELGWQGTDRSGQGCEGVGKAVRTKKTAAIQLLRSSRHEWVC